MKLTRLEKIQLLTLLNRNDFLSMISSSAAEGDDESFKEDYGFNMARARKIYEHLMEALKN